MSSYRDYLNLGWFHCRLEETKEELEEFRESSRELEYELESQLEQLEKKNKELNAANSRLHIECENLMVRMAFRHRIYILKIKMPDLNKYSVRMAIRDSFIRQRVLRIKFRTLKNWS